MLGIIIGVASVIILVSIVNGYMSYMVESFSSMGVNQITVQYKAVASRSIDVNEFYEFYEEHSDLYETMSPNVSVSVTVKHDSDTMDSTSVGGYAVPEKEEENSAQFDVSDNRTLDEVVNWLLRLGYIPRFCTACYREGRTGDRFMSLVKSGQIANCCHPNALMTLKEYLTDYAKPHTKELGENLIQNELANIPNPKVRELVIQHLTDIENGERDFRL